METNPTENILTNVRIKLNDVRKMLNTNKKVSTENEVYKIKYEAIEILESLETDLIKVVNDIPEEEKGKEVIILAGLHLNLGLLHADTDELKAGEEQFMKCILLLKNKELEPEAVLPVLSALNQLSIIWSQWNEPAKAKGFLDQAEQIYKDFTDTNNVHKEPIVDMTLNFGIVLLEEGTEELSAMEMLEKIHTLTLYYLAQVYRSLKDHCQSAMYCYMTLRRQLAYIDHMPEFDYIDWALNVATLSLYFMENDDFSQARHNLAAASYMLQKYEEKLKNKSENNGESEALAAEWETFKHRSADVARCWAKYGLWLMTSSRQRLLQKNEAKLQNDQTTNKASSTAKILANLKFDVLEEEIQPIANQITDKYVLDFDDAKMVFLNTQKWLEQAKMYYTLENHASDYIIIVQDISQAYKYLSFFEDHEDRQAKMHKRRIDMLESVLKELNPQYYTFACRQIWIELGETYSDLLYIKLDRLRSIDESPTPQLLTKINHLANSSIKNFLAFLDSIENRNPNSDEIQPFPDELLQPVLVSYFHLGRLYNKIITPDKSVQLENTQNSINAYKFIIDYCQKYPKAADIMEVELNHCKELLSLLLIKRNKLREIIN